MCGFIWHTIPGLHLLFIINTGRIEPRTGARSCEGDTIRESADGAVDLGGLLVDLEEDVFDLLSGVGYALELSHLKQPILEGGITGNLIDQVAQVGDDGGVGSRRNR